MDDTPTRRRFLAASAGALTTAFAGCSAAPGADSTANGEGSQPTATATADGSGTADGSVDPGTGIALTEDVYSEVYRETIDSVVLVEVPGGQGTGFVFDDSHVVTNAHVVGRAEEASVRFNAGEWRTGPVAGVDPHSDLAAVEVDGVPDPATPLSLADEPPTVGQVVAAIGNPYALNGSVTTGVVSGDDRLIPSPSNYRIPDAVQTDAAVNPGNSGGPLMSLDGDVVAVINSGGGDNIAFGISAALTRRVVPELIENGDYDHASPGARFTDVTPSIAEANGLDEPRGVLVLDVRQNGPADGVLRPSDQRRFVDGNPFPAGGDVLLAADDRTLSTVEDFWSYLGLETRPGDSVELRLLRDGTAQTVSLELGTRTL